MNKKFVSGLILATGFFAWNAQNQQVLADHEAVYDYADMVMCSNRLSWTQRSLINTQMDLGSYCSDYNCISNVTETIQLIASDPRLCLRYPYNPSPYYPNPPSPYYPYNPSPYYPSPYSPYWMYSDSLGQDILDFDGDGQGSESSESNEALEFKDKVRDFIEDNKEHVGDRLDAILKMTIQ